MKVLFAVDSFFQLMESANLRLTIYKDAIADVAIYASTPNANTICCDLKKTGLFNNCFLIDTPLVRCGNKYSFIDKLPKYFIYIYTLINPEKYVVKLLDLTDLNYDIFLFSGNGALPECIFNAIYKNNQKIICMRFEDSYISYTREYGKLKSRVRTILENTIHKIFHGESMEKYIKGYYFAEPCLVQTKFKYPTIQAPKISRENPKLIEALNSAFRFCNLKDKYSEKYIFFESGDSYFEKNNEDIEFVKELVNAVGKKNVLIKRHPRCVENRFEKLGVHIAKSSCIPWELIQLNINMDNKVFITTTSAAALSSEIYFGDNCKTILLFEGMKKKPSSVTDVMRNYLFDFQSKFGNDKLYLPCSMNDFKNIIREEV